MSKWLIILMIAIAGIGYYFWQKGKFPTAALPVSTKALEVAEGLARVIGLNPEAEGFLSENQITLAMGMHGISRAEAIVLLKRAEAEFEEHKRTFPRLGGITPEWLAEHFPR